MGAKERFDLSGLIALVTGGSRGIGRGIALGLAEHGAEVAIVFNRAREAADEVAQQIRSQGRQAWVYQQDLAETEKLGNLADTICRDAGKVDILVNNAGLGYLEAFNKIGPETWRRTMAVNLDAAFFLTQRIAEHMIAQKIKGRVIHVSSVNGYCAEGGLAHYNASKGALELMSKSFAIELGAHGITSNTICPGIIETEIGEDFELAPGFNDYFKQHIPLEHHFGNVEDCVGAVIFLASRAGAYMTGQRLVLDGGVSCDQVPRMQFMPPYENTMKSPSR